MSPTNLLLLALGAIGHAILWVMLVNRLHAVALNRKLMDFLTGLCGLAVALLPLAIATGLLYGEGATRTAAWSYATFCAFVCVVATVRRLQTYLHPERRGVVLANHTARFDTGQYGGEPLTAPGVATWLSRLPGNEVLNLLVHEKQLVVPRLSAAHEGLRIVHLSDLHMSGRITKTYFAQVVDRVNATQPDVVAITGDIVERNHCLDWIPDTLGRLRARGGVYYVLGNHDKKVDVFRLHQALADAGLIHVGGRCEEVAVGNSRLILAGNALPWFGPACDFSACPAHNADGQPLRMLLAHSPDQFAWAQANEVDLMLAGHNHGGQICLPLFGAILAPSLHGVRYAAGAFCSGNTVLHVSRGTSCLTPIRWNCPPEIAVLVLRSA
jgi:predicted MPP superfamily phosphohydrolase